MKRYKLNQQLLSFIIFLFIYSFAGCGHHKAQVQAPRRPGNVPPAAKRTEPAKPASVTTRQEPPLQARSPQEAAERPGQAVISGAVAAPSSIPSGPQIRIGLITNATEVRISSSGDFYLMEKIPEAERELLQGEIQVRVEHGPEEASTIYRVQIASFTDPDAAKELQGKLARTLSAPVSVRQNPATGASQVRAGEFINREDAQAFVKVMAASGYRDAFIVKDDVVSGGKEKTLALRGLNYFHISETGFLFSPSSNTSFLSVDGKPYRGIIDISLNSKGRITLVNQLGIEEYLLGVVPAELSPSQYSEFAAQAAQSIAARTFALRNMGKYRSEGFDLTADTRTQVYNGVLAERDASTDAVLKTSGLAIYYQDQLIDAMYMSTCGGRTEDFSNVFDLPQVPYLKSVFCTIENNPEKAGQSVIEGSHELDQAITADDGSMANRNVEFARVLGLLESGQKISPEYLTGTTERREIMHWIEKARALAQRSSSTEAIASTDVTTQAGFLRFAAESFFGPGEIKRKISELDAEYYIGNLKDGNSIPQSARYALAYLMQRGLWRPHPDNSVGAETPIRRSDALSLLIRWIESVRPEILRKGTFAGIAIAESGKAGQKRLSLKWEKRTQEFPLAEHPNLYRVDLERTTPVNSLRIIGNEKISFHLNPAGKIDFLEVELNPTGASNDRYSPSATWDVTLSRAVVAEKLRDLTGAIGELKDLKPSRIGSSGRAVQIQVVGSRRSVILNGYRVRGALGLKDTLFTLTRGRNPDGEVSSFTFHGRGWGHGVGLCQVGAYGMARTGSTYEEILKTYYQGVEIRKAY